MGGNFQMLFQLFMDRQSSTGRSDFDHFWPTFTWIQNWIICRCGRTHEEKKKKEEKEKRNQIFHFTTGTGGNPARPSGHWNIVTRAREPVGNGVTKSTYHYVLFNSSPRPQLLCARVPLENNNRLKCNVKMNRPYIIRREHKGTIYHFWVGTGRRSYYRYVITLTVQFHWICACVNSGGLLNFSSFFFFI